MNFSEPHFTSALTCRGVRNRQETKFQLHLLINPSAVSLLASQLSPRSSLPHFSLCQGGDGHSQAVTLSRGKPLSGGTGGDQGGLSRRGMLPPGEGDTAKKRSSLSSLQHILALAPGWGCWWLGHQHYYMDSWFYGFRTRQFQVHPVCSSGNISAILCMMWMPTHLGFIASEPGNSKSIQPRFLREHLCHPLHDVDANTSWIYGIRTRQFQVHPAQVIQGTPLPSST